MAGKQWQIVTEARIAAARACLRRHWFAYELGIRPVVEAESLRFASALRRGRDLFQRGVPPPEAVRRALEAYGGEQTPAAGGQAERRQHLVRPEQISRLLSGYFWFWSHPGLEAVAAQPRQVFELPIVNPASGRASRSFRLAGLVDGVERLPDGRLAVMPFVTTGRSLEPDSDFSRLLEISGTLSLSWLAARAVGQRPDVCVCDAVRRPQIKPKTLTPRQTAAFLASGRYWGQRFEVRSEGTAALRVGDELAELELRDGVLAMRETASMYGARLAGDIRRRPGFYFARREMREPAAGLDQTRRDIWQWTQILRQCQRQDRWPRNTSACVGFGRCPYLDLCRKGVDPRVGALPAGFVKVQDLHPELCVDGRGASRTRRRATSAKCGG